MSLWGDVESVWEEKCNIHHFECHYFDINAEMLSLKLVVL